MLKQVNLAENGASKVKSFSYYGTWHNVCNATVSATIYPIPMEQDKIFASNMTDFTPAVEYQAGQILKQAKLI